MGYSLYLRIAEKMCPVVPAEIVFSHVKDSNNMIEFGSSPPRF
jgi:hypothetical protein